MVRLILILGVFVRLCALQGVDSLVIEVDDPDELRYELELIDQIAMGASDQEHDPFQIMWSELFDRPLVIEQGVMRQRLQYSPSLNGWRFMNKGWVRTPLLNMTFVVEQDPGEKSNSDHAAFSISSNRVGGLDQIMLGSFTVRAGSGMLFSPGYSRFSILPGSLITKLDPKFRAHYSTRETDYLRGIAAQWNREKMDVLTYVSEYEEAGLLAIYKHDILQLFVGSKINQGLAVELGFQLQNDYQTLQLFTVLSSNFNRLVAEWSFKYEQLRFSLQLRRYAENRSFQSPPLRLLGQNEQGENAYSFRVQTNPMKYLRLHLSFDGGKPLHSTSLSDLQHLQQFTLVSILKVKKKELQIHFSNKSRRSIYPEDPWTRSDMEWRVNRSSLAYTHKLSKWIKYRLNLKTASSVSLRSMLIQQRTQWSPNEYWSVNLGYSRYLVPGYRLNLTTYENGLLESYSFFTAFDDGQRWFLHVRYSHTDRGILECRIAQTEKFGEESILISPSIGFQLSIVL